ncbi:hypothetical protein B0O79_1023 [Flavobacteriaceae bacterium MAR_2009_75]|nr:hypothetical protein B0O79_1023 [Flavobacteriaceae bacterium MAR_2009_75]
MGLYEYLMLSEESQWNELWDNGKFLENFKSIDCSFSLYGLYDFFVEIELDPMHNTILCKHVFKQGEKLDKYLDNIEL